MAKIFFTKLNEVWGEVQADEPGLILDVAQHFTFIVPNYKFTPAYKSGYWDGKIRLLKGRKLYAGLVNKLKEYCKENDIEFDTDISDNTKVDISEVVKIIKEYDPYRYNDDRVRIPLEAHYEQVEAIRIGLEEKRCIIVNPTASGKSFIIATLTRIFEELGLKTLIYLSLTTLATQLPADFKEYYQHVWDADIDTVYGGKETGEGSIVVGLWQSLKNKKSDYFEQFDVVIADEVHEASSDVAKRIFEQCINAEYRIGLTGTLRDTKIDLLVLEGTFGKAHQLATTAQLMAEGKIAGINIRQLVYPHDFKDFKLRMKDIKAANPRANPFQWESTYIATNSKRIGFVKDLALAQKGNTLILFTTVAHGEEIFRRISEEHEHTYIIHGGVAGEVRDDIKLIADTKQKGVIICASYKTFSTGANVKNIHTTILADSIRSKTRLGQTIGRGLRIKADKSKLLLLDIADNLPIIKGHALDRIERYIIEKFPFKVVKL